MSGAGNAGGPQVLQISQAQGGQRVAVPIKMLLQPQVDFLINMQLLKMEFILTEKLEF